MPGGNLQKLTQQEVKAAAAKHGIDYPALRAVIEVECKGAGFQADGLPVILFERHKFWQALGKLGLFSLRKKARAENPNICNSASGGYGYYSAQHKRLAIAASYHRDAALESASWGIGQVMGFNWRSLDYDSLQEFINDMYESEAKQLEAMIRYIKRHNLKRHLNAQEWASFARGYNGPAYKVNNYDTKLADSHARFVAELPECRP